MARGKLMLSRRRNHMSMGAMYPANSRETRALMLAMEEVRRENAELRELLRKQLRATNDMQQQIGQLMNST